MNYWQNYPRFMVSLLKAAYGKNATKENDFGYAWLPKVDGNYSWMYIYDDMYRGSSMRAGGRSPARRVSSRSDEPGRIGPNTSKTINALSKLKWLVVVENYEIETAIFWKAPKEYGGPEPSKSRRKSSSSRPRGSRRRTGPSRTRPAGCSGSGRPSTRPAVPRPTRRSSRGSSSRPRPLQEGGGAGAENVLNMSWNYTNPRRRTSPRS